MPVIRCGSCGVGIRFDLHKIKPSQPTLRCPRCQTLNRIDLSQFAEAEDKTEVQNDRTEISGGNAFEKTVIQDGSGQAQVRAQLRHKANGQTYSLQQGENLLGRPSQSSPYGKIEIEDDRYISRSHCLITLDLSPSGKQRCVLQDQGSANKTYLNGEAISGSEALYLTQGDVIRLGRTELVFELVS